MVKRAGRVADIVASGVEWRRKISENFGYRNGALDVISRNATTEGRHLEHVTELHPVPRRNVPSLYVQNSTFLYSQSPQLNLILVYIL
jgi:hypothetical protein